MTTQTRKDIQNTYEYLASVKLVDKITVKEIVEHCQINRNTFYYHFQDLPEVAQSVMEEMMLKALEMPEGSDSKDGVGRIMEVLEAKKDLCRNIYFSKDRIGLEVRMLETIETVVRQLLEETAFKKYPVSLPDRERIIRKYKCDTMGQIVDWMHNGSRYDLAEYMERMYVLREGELERMLEKASGKHSGTSF